MMHLPTISASASGPSTSGQPAMSFLVLLPASAHMAHNNPSPLAPASASTSARNLQAPSPLISRKSGSTVPSLKVLAHSQQSRLRHDEEEEEKSPEAGQTERADPMLYAGGGGGAAAGRRSSLAPGMGTGTERRAFHPTMTSTATSKLGAIESSPPGTPDRSGSGSPSPGDATPPASAGPSGSAFDSYKLSSSSSSAIRGATTTTATTAGSTSASASPTNPLPTTSATRAPIPAGSSEAPSFGSRAATSSASGPGARRSRRPVTAATTGVGTQQPLQRGSMALPRGSGLGMGGGGAKNRPGWEADEIVSVLRSGGLEVTLVRNASHLPPILSSPSGSLSVRPGSNSGQVTPVILVPLCDSPSLPSLSLLLAQGTTPTAVCFQQDLLERAKQTEDEWLPSALAQIRTAVDMRNQSSSSSSSASSTTLATQREALIILAYSANPGLSPYTTQSCIAAGASGVVKPPFNYETVRMVKRMVRAARDGRISSVVDLPPDSPAAGNVDPSRSPILSWAPGTGGAGDKGSAASVATASSAATAAATATKVVLPPTALDMGGEHEGEKVLSAAMTHRRQVSHSARNHEPLSLSSLTPVSLSVQHLRQNRDILTPLTAVAAARQQRTPTSAEMIANPYVATLSRYCPTYTPRRRSVDVGCLSLALNRATRAFKSPLPIYPPPPPHPHPSSGHGTPMRKTKTQLPPGSTGKLAPALAPGPPTTADLEHQHVGTETHLAELLSEMYCQSTVATDVQMAEYARLSARLSAPERRRLVDALATWHFKPHRLDDDDLFRVATLLFEAVLSTEGVAELGIERDQINRLLFALRAIYHAPNPYHNYIHAIDVLQATYTFLMDVGLVPPYDFLLELEANSSEGAGAGASMWRRPEETVKPVLGKGTRRARQVMRPQDVFAVLLAAMGHDVGHPGLSNAFMKNAKTPLSEVYDDKSVLENMHCMLVVRLLRKHGFDHLINASAASESDSKGKKSFDTNGFRKVLYSSVLATDMSLHFAWIARLKDFAAGLQSGDQEGQREEEPGQEEEEDRIMISQAIIKCADISNPTRPIDVSEHWSSVLLEEWAKQASLEQELDLPVSVIASADAALQAKGQIGFIDLFTQPLFEAVSDILPELQSYADSCAENRSLWQTRLDDLSAHPDHGRIVQPAIDSAASDDRFRSLFPLLLPPSLLLDLPPPAPAPAASYSSPATPATATATASAPQIFTPSPPDASSTKAMRAVYYTDLLEHKHRGGLVSSVSIVPIPGVGGIDWDFDRRMSTPGGVL